MSFSCARQCGPVGVHTLSRAHHFSIRGVHVSQRRPKKYKRIQPPYVRQRGPVAMHMCSKVHHLESYLPKREKRASGAASVHVLQGRRDVKSTHCIAKATRHLGLHCGNPKNTNGTPSQNTAAWSECTCVGASPFAKSTHDKLKTRLSHSTSARFAQAQGRQKLTNHLKRHPPH